MKKALSLALAMIMLVTMISGCTTLVKLEDGSRDKGAIIDMYLTTEVYNFDPQISITDESMLTVMSLIYEGLTRLDENGKWTNAIMESYTYREVDGEYVLSIKMKETRWSDERTVQAADFVYAWKRILEPDSKSEAASLLYDIKNARKIKAGDATVDDLGMIAASPYAIEIRFEYDVDLDNFFRNCSSVALSPLREDIISKTGEDTWACKHSTIMTNGPFSLKQLVYGNVIRLERSRYYYLDPPDMSNPQGERAFKVDKYVIPYRLLTKHELGDAEAQLALYEEGKLFYMGYIPLSAREQYKDEAVVSDMMATHSYMFNTNNPLFKSAEVRRALSLAIDRTEVVKLITFAKPATGLVPTKVFDKDTKSTFREVGGDILSATANVAEAKSLLSAAGVNGGSFSISVRNNEVDLAIADYVKGVWNALGFDVTVKALGATPTKDDNYLYIDTFQNAYDAGDFDVIAFDMTMLSADAFQVLAQYADGFSGNGVDMNSGNYEIFTHVSGYSSEEYNAIIEAAYGATEQAARVEKLHEAEEKLLLDMPIIPVVFLQDAYLASDELSGIKSSYYGVRDFNRTKLKDYMTYKALTDTAKKASEKKNDETVTAE